MIELSIVLAIGSLCSALAVPAFTQHMINTNRGQAEVDLLELAAAAERYHVANDSYAGISAAALGRTQSPASGTALYLLTAVTSDRGYLLSATPVPGQINHANGALSLDATGLRTWDRNNDGVIEDNEGSW
jgi:type IV pilus assembly protein PilE